LHDLLCKESEDEHVDSFAAATDKNDEDDKPEPSMIQGTDALMTVVDMQDNSLAVGEDDAQQNND